MIVKETSSGKFVKTLGGYEAFVPNPLPPIIIWDEILAHTLSQANHTLGKLAHEGAVVANPHLLIRPFVAREAVLSSKIEGTRASLGEVLADEVAAEDASEKNYGDLQEIRNYIVALEHGLFRLKEGFPLSLRLIKEMHAKLMAGVRGDHAKAGEFRRTQNWIGLPGSTLATAKYVPPPTDELTNCLTQLEAFLHDKTLPPLVHIALCHYQFEAIHPFIDGNGRIGRLLITLLLIEHQLLPSPLLYLSAFFEATRSEYYKQLHSISVNGTWNEWLSYFLNGVALQSADVLSRTHRITHLINSWQAQISSSLCHLVLKQCTANPFLTAKLVAEKFDVAFTTAQRALKQLESAGIIKQVNENKRGRIYCATEILAILEEPANINAIVK